MFDIFGWMSAIIDGEGHLQIVRHTSGSYTPRLTVGSTTKRLIDVLHARFGGQSYLMKSRNPKAKSAWLWQLSGAPVVELLKRVEPYLEVKKTQAQLVLAVPRFHELNGYKWTQTDLDIAAAYHEDIKECNRRGAFIKEN